MPRSGLLQIEHHLGGDPVLFQQGQGFTALGAARIVVDLGLAHDNSLINRKMGQKWRYCRGNGWSG